MIALIAFSVAVIDGPNIVERLFGIDAGLKNGWGVLAGAYAGGKLISGAGGAVMNKMSRSNGVSDAEKEGNVQNDKGTGQQTKNGAAIENAVSPNDGEGKGMAQTGLAAGGIAAGVAAGKKGIHAGAEKNKGLEKSGQAPSPNDDIDLSKENVDGSTESNETSGTAGTAPGNANYDKAILTGNEKGPQESSQGAGASEGHIPSPNDLKHDDSSVSGVGTRQVGSNGSAPSPNDADRSGDGLSTAGAAGSVQNEQLEQRITGRTDSEIESINEQVGGSTAVRDSSVGGSGSGPSPAASPNADNAAAPSSTGGQTRNETSSAPSGNQQSTTNINRSGGDQTIDENIIVTETQGNTMQGTRNVTSNTSGTSDSGGFNSEVPAAPGLSSASSGGTSRTINQDRSSRENIVNETTVNQTHQQDTQQIDRTSINESRRPRTHNLNQQESNTLDRIKNYRRNR